MYEEDNATPVDDIKWSGDTPHPYQQTDQRTTCETLWLAQSSKGDYHDNMTGDLFTNMST